MESRILSVQLFPHVLVRLTGRPFELLQALELPESSRLARQHLEATRALEQLRDEVCDTLHQLVPRLERPADRTRLVGLKRDIFNGRRMDAQRLERLAPLLPAEGRERLERWLEATRALQASFAEGERTFAAEFARARQRLRQLASDDTLGKGLLLSSASLFEALPAYVAADAPEAAHGDPKLELGLIKYVSRLCAKTSPFSTFTQLAMAHLEQTPGTGPVHLEPVAGAGYRSHVRLNNYLCYDLLRLLEAVPEVRRLLPLRLNPSAAREADGYVFLVNENNVESFQRTAAHPLIELLWEKLGPPGVGLEPFGELVQALLEDVEAEEAELEQFLEQLVDYGLLEFDLGISGADPDWDARLRERLEPHAGTVPLLGDLVARLRELRELTGKYERASLGEREALLSRLFALVRELWEGLAAQGVRKSPPPEATPEPSPASYVFSRGPLRSFDFSRQKVLFEDTAAELRPHLAARPLEELVERLEGLAGELELFDQYGGERHGLVAFFKARYGEAEVPLLRFYEEYYRDYKLTERERLRAQRPSDSEAPEEPVVVARREWSRRTQGWLDGVRERLGADTALEADTVHLRLEHLRSPGGPRPPRATTSHSAFLQLFLDAERTGEPRLMAVLNHGFLPPGYGKPLSRFLHFFEDTTQAQRRWNELPDDEALYLEACDGSFFNANLHPPLLPWEIGTPNSQNSLPPRQRIPVVQLVARLRGEELELRHVDTGRRVYLFDLGFQTMGRSPLFQFLRNFTPASFLTLHPLLRTVSAAWRQHQGLASEPEAVRSRPRVVLEGSLVLQRRGWKVPRALLPERVRGDSEWQAFVKLQQWRLALGLPEEVFLVVAEGRPGTVRRDDDKPQYIHFGNPFLARLFYKLAQRVPDALQLEEMLPAPRHLVRAGPASLVTEYAVQWYTGLGEKPSP